MHTHTHTHTHSVIVYICLPTNSMTTCRPRVADPVGSRHFGSPGKRLDPDPHP